MARRRPFSLMLLLLMAMTLLVTGVSCTKDGDTVYKPDPAEQQASTAPLVIVIHNVEGVGDQSYNDLIYQGVEEAALQHGLRTLQLSPKTQREGLAYLEELFQQMSAASDTIRRLCIVSGPAYDDFIRKNNNRLESNPRASLLYLETNKPLEGKGSTLQMPYYGAMYKAGSIASFFASEVTLVGANPVDMAVAEAVEGFTAGFNERQATGATLNTIYLTEKANSGYAISDEDALRLLSDNEIDNVYAHLLVPVCGGALSTFARLADITNAYTFMGVDTSWPSVYCHFSAVKHIDLAVAQCIGQWLSAEGMPKHQSFGLATGYTELLLHPQTAEIRSLVQQQLTDAVMADIPNYNEPYMNLFDNNTNTKWYVQAAQKQDGVWFVEFNGNYASSPKGYKLYTGSDTSTYPLRNPVAWKLYGKTYETDQWTLMDERDTEKNTTDALPTSNSADKAFTFKEVKSYKFFRLEISKSKGDSDMQLSRFLFTY